MSHRKAVWLMVAVTLMWSIAGVVTRHLEAARGFEVTFWRSAFNALALVVMLGWLRGPAALWRRHARRRPRAVDVGPVLGVMYTAFMLALTLTTVANVLITMALGRCSRRWARVCAAATGCGAHLGAIAWPGWASPGCTAARSAAPARHLLGTLVALGVPIAAAVNWTLMQHLHHGDDDSGAAATCCPRC
jgi:drug/metabolite transporter (DMT)-like permease